MADPVPAQVATAARSIDLGELQGVYTGPSNSLYALLWWAYAFIIGGPGIAALSPGQGFLGNGSATSKTITVLFGVVLTLCAAAMAWRGVQIVRHRRLYLYKGGVVYTHPSGRAKWYGTWHDVRVYWGQGTTRNAESYRLVFPQGGKVKWGLMTAYRDSKALTEGVGGQARKLSTAWKLPTALTRLRNGETLEFGPLFVDSSGVICRDKNLAWREITSVTLIGKIALAFAAPRKPGISVQLTKIPDLGVLLRLIEVARNS